MLIVMCNRKKEYLIFVTCGLFTTSTWATSGPPGTFVPSPMAILFTLVIASVVICEIIYYLITKKLNKEISWLWVPVGSILIIGGCMYAVFS